MVVSKMLDEGVPEPIDGSSDAWLGAEHTEMSERIKASFLHGPRYIYVRIQGLEQGENVEIVLGVPGRDEWALWLGTGNDTDVKLPPNAPLLPEFKVETKGGDLLLSLVHLHLAPQGFLAGTPIDGEEWNLALRVYPPGGSVPVAWLDEDAKLKFAGGRSERPIRLKDGEPVEWGIGQNLIRLDFGQRIPQGAGVEIQPEDFFIPKRSKDISYVRGRIARGGEYRVTAEVPALPPPEPEEAAPKAAEEENQESSEEETAAQAPAPTETRYVACVSFFVRGLWKRFEEMEDHILARTSAIGEMTPEIEEAVAAFQNSLASAEKYRTAQAKGVLKADTRSAVENSFFGVLEVMRSAAAGSSPVSLSSAYPENAVFRKGLITTARDEEQAAKAVDRARSLGADFLMLAVEGGVQCPQPDDLVVVPGRLVGHFSRAVEFNTNGTRFRILVDPSGPPEALPPHLADARAVAGDVRYWHNALAAGHRLSYAAIDRGIEGKDGTPFVHVAADAEAGAIAKAMAEGAFYVRVHPSPEVAEIKIEGGTLKIRRAKVGAVCQIVLIGRDGPLGLSPTDTAEYTFKGSEQFIRIQMLAGATKVGERPVDLTTILNPVYPADWVAPWLEETMREEVVEDEEDAASEE